MRLAFFGSGAFAIPTLRRLVTDRHGIALVVSQPARGSGRRREVAPTPLAREAVELRLPVSEIAGVNAPEFIDRIRALQVDLGIVIAFGQKIGAELRSAIPGGFINLHASLLPKYRGAAPINWTIINGERTTGCTVFRIVERMDAGPILATDSTIIDDEETAGELHDRLAELGTKTVTSAIGLLEKNSGFLGTTQDELLASRAPKLSKRDGFLHFRGSLREIINHLRGVTPWPGGQAVFVPTRGKREDVVFLRLRDGGTSIADESTMGAVDAEGHVRVGDGRLQIVELKPAGGRGMSWEDFANGRRVKCGDMFMTPDRE